MNYKLVSNYKLIFLLVLLIIVVMQSSTLAVSPSYDEVYVDIVPPTIKSIAVRSNGPNNYSVSAVVVDYDGPDGEPASSEDISARRYMITNSKTPPLVSDFNWQESNNITSNLRGYIYAWVKAVDYVGNVTIESRYFGYLNDLDEFSYRNEPETIEPESSESQGGEYISGDEEIYSGTTYDNNEVYADVWVDFEAPQVLSLKIDAEDNSSFVITPSIKDPVLEDGSPGSQEDLTRRRYIVTDSPEAPSTFADGWQSSNTLSSNITGDMYIAILVADKAGNSRIEVKGVTSEEYTITTSVSGTPPHGTVSPSGATQVRGGLSQTITFDPDDNYTIDSILVDDVEQTEYGVTRQPFLDNGYTFSEISADHTLVVSYTPDNNGDNIPDYQQSYHIVGSVDGGNGTIDPVGSQSVLAGAYQTFHFVPSSGYTILSLKVDNVEQTEYGVTRIEYITHGYTFERVTSDHTIVVSFGPDANGDDIPDSQQEINAVLIRDKINVDKTPPSITNIEVTKTGEDTYQITADVVDPLGEGGAKASQENVSLRAYMITNDNTPPDKDSPYWSATNTISTNVTGEIYGWVRAIDNVGNASVEGKRYGVISPGEEPPIEEDEEELLNKYTIKEVIRVDKTPPTINNISVNQASSNQYEIVASIFDPDLPDSKPGSQENESARRYMITTSSTEPDPYSEDWEETNTLTTSLNGNLYFWVMAEDNVGNRSIDYVQLNSVQYTITSSVVGGNGTINPAGATSVREGNNLLVRMTPDPGYTIKSLKVDNVEQTVTGEPRTQFVIGGYTFTNVVADHTIVVTYAEDENGNTIPDDEEFFDIDSSVNGGHGTIDPDGTTVVPYGANKLYTFDPDDGYTILYLKVDGVEQTVSGEPRTELLSNGYTFTHVLQDHTIIVSYDVDVNNNDIPDSQEAHYNITTSVSGGNGTITPSGTTSVLVGDNFHASFAPTTGYTIKSLKDNNVEKTTNGAPRTSLINNGYDITNVQEAHTVVVSYGRDENGNNIPDDEEFFTITSSVVGGHGTITPNGSQTVAYGANKSYSFSPEDGYTLKSLKVDNVEQTVEGQPRTPLLTNGYTFTYVVADHTIVATFSVDENDNDIPDDEEGHFDITTSVVGGHGGINPNGTTTVLGGSSLTVTFSPDTGYTIKSLKLDNVEQTTAGAPRTTWINNGYVFNGIGANHTLVVTYGIDENGNNIPDDEEYYVIVSSVSGSNGSINPQGSQSVLYGANKHYDLTPNQGYTILSLKVDNVEQTVPNTSRLDLETNGYTFTHVEANHTITVSFDTDANEDHIPDSQQAHYNITTSVSGGNGGISPNGTTSVLTGMNLSVTFSPNSGYTIKSLKIDNVEQATAGVARTAWITGGYTFTNVTANHTLVVSYGRDENGNNIPDDEEYFTIVSSVVGGNGTITPNGNTSVQYGANQSYSFNPATDYTIKSLKVDNDEQTHFQQSREPFITNGYKFTYVVANHTIVVTYGLDANHNHIPDDEEDEEVPPEGSISIRNTVEIPTGDQAIGSQNVVLDIVGTDNESATEDLMMAILNEAQVTGTLDISTLWEQFAAEKNWTLSNGDGTKTVYLILKDEVGNTTVIPTP